MADTLNPRSPSEVRGAKERTAAEAAARAFPALLVEAERLAATIIAGDHGRRQSGTGETFWQFRHFREGDPRSAVDWRRSAKSDAYYVRETEWELAQSVWLWCDRSLSMTYKSHLANETKDFRAAVLALGLALLLTRGGERVGDLGHDARARRGEAALSGLTLTLTTSPKGAMALPPVDDRLRRANLVLFSDLLRPAEDVAAFIAAAAAQGAHGHIVQVFDPAEESWPFEGRILFEDEAAGNHLLTGRAESLRATYREKLEAHREIIGDAARRAGWSFLVHHTDAAPQTALLALYARLAGDAEAGMGAGLNEGRGR